MGPTLTKGEGNISQTNSRKKYSAIISWYGLNLFVTTKRLSIKISWKSKSMVMILRPGLQNKLSLISEIESNIMKKFMSTWQLSRVFRI